MADVGELGLLGGLEDVVDDSWSVFGAHLLPREVPVLRLVSLE